MSYTVMLDKAIDDDVVDDENPSWIANSYKTIPNYQHGDYDKIDRQYEQTFNLKILYVKKERKAMTGTMYDDSTIIGIEFPSKDDAIMFMLRWS